LFGTVLKEKERNINRMIMVSRPKRQQIDVGAAGKRFLNPSML